MKKSQSFEENIQQSQQQIRQANKTINALKLEKKMSVQSNISMNKSKFPDSIKSSIIKQSNKQNSSKIKFSNHNQNDEVKQQQISNEKISSKITKDQCYKLNFVDKLKYTLKTSQKAQTVPIFTCGICQTQFNQFKKVQMFHCNHYYCQSCVHSYVIYKVGIMEDVVCPNDQCDKLINQHSKAFNDLPFQIQKKTKRNVLFKLTIKNKDLKLCPFENCEQGVINLTQDPLKCHKCQTIICKSCMMKDHQGSCKTEQINFMQNNLKYRQCKQCKSILEKSQGCDYIKCPCGFRLCYKCGQRFSLQHRCQNEQQVHQSTCCELNFGQCPLLIKIILKILFLMLSIVVVIFILLKTLFWISILLFFTFFSGIFQYSCKIIEKACAYHQLLGFLLILILPITLILGIGYAIYDKFWFHIDQFLYFGLMDIINFYSSILFF